MAPEFTITFPGASPAQANRFSESLANVLRDTGPEIFVERRRTRDDTQDFGTSLVLVLGTTSVTVVARGISAWIAKNAGAQIEISSDGKVLGKNLNSADAAKIAEAFAKPNN
jgi:hypothetical protein